MTKYRSAASLLISGAATITLDQHVRVPKVGATSQALQADQRQIMRDARRVATSLAGRVGGR